MTSAIKTRLNELSVEELANTITHGFGLVLSLAGFIVLVTLAGLRGEPLLIAACLVYGLSLIVLYAASTIYHGTTSPELKHALRLVDHCCIYLLIAGTYTPFASVIIDDTIGRSVLAAIWFFAIGGILLKLLFRDRFQALSVILYLVMGWLGVLAIQPMLAALGVGAVILAIAGGLAYSLGVVFYASHRIPHNHAVFHVFVLAGSILHFVAVVIYVVPYGATL
jgi:hemolysin III